MSLYTKQTARTISIEVTNSDIDLSTATSPKILYKSAAKSGEWTAVINGNKLEYAIQSENDIAIDGDWQFQGYFEIGGKSYYTDVGIQSFVDPLN